MLYITARHSIETRVTGKYGDTSLTGLEHMGEMAVKALHDKERLTDLVATDLVLSNLEEVRELKTEDLLQYGKFTGEATRVVCEAKVEVECRLKLRWLESDDVVDTATYRIDHRSSTPLDDVLCVEAWREAKVCLTHLKLFGCDSYFKLLLEPRCFAC